MNKLDYGGQSAKDCIEYIRHITPSKITKPFIGANFIYSDFLYLYSGVESMILKKKFTDLIIRHKNSLQKIIEKNPIEFQIGNAFNYLSWVQLYLGTKDFHENLNKVKNIYREDSLFQKYIAEDCALFEKKY